MTFHPPTLDRRQLLQAGAAAAATLVVPGLSASTPKYPVRPVKVIVPFPPGGSADVLTRVLANAMGATLGQTFIIENRAGGGGSLDVQQAVRAEPDGYTLGVTSLGPHVLLPQLGRKLPYEPLKDLVPIGHMGGMGLAIIARNGLKANTLGEAIALAKAEPGKVTFGSSGVPGQLAIEQLKRASGADFLHVPYKGDTPMASDLIGGQIDLAMLTVTAAMPHVGARTFKILATTGQQRDGQLANVPNVAELGFPGFAAELWYVLAAPTGTPAHVISTQAAALKKALSDPEVIRQFAQQGMTQQPMDTPTVQRFVNDEYRKWGDIIRATGLRIEE